MKVFSLVALFFFPNLGRSVAPFASKIFVQNDQRVLSGVVTDKASGEVLVGVTIKLEGESLRGAVTNIYGFYSLSLQEGSHRVWASYVGYSNASFDVSMNSDVKLDIAMEEKIEELKEVIITNKIRKSNSTELNVRTLSSDYIKSLPALLGEADINTAVKLLPGVSSVSDASSGFNVRGGRVDQNLVLVDEGPIFNTSHLFGLISTINSDAIRDVKFYSSGIPARYGGRASSVLDIHLKEGNNKQLALKGGISPLSSRLGIEFPIVKNKLNVLISGRRSFVDLFLKGNTNVWFYDLTSKLTYAPNANNKFHFSSYLGRDRMVFDDSNISWGNAFGTFRWSHIFSSRLFSNLTLLTGNYQFIFSSSGGEIFGDSDQDKDTPSQLDNSIKTTQIKYDMNYYLSNENQFDFGLIAINNRFVPSNISGGSDFNFFEQQSAFEYGLYTDAYLHTGERLKWRLGLRYSGSLTYGPNHVAVYDSDSPPDKKKQTQILLFKKNEPIKHYQRLEPRLSLNYRFSDNQSIKLAYDGMAQYIHLLSNSLSAVPFDTWTPTGYHIPPTITSQYNIGYVREQNLFDFELTFFYKRQQNLLEFKNGANTMLNDFIETEIIPARGTSHGVELFLNKAEGRLTGSLSYTYSRSRVHTTSPFPAAQINQGKPFSANSDRPHIAHLVVGYKVSERVSIISRFTFQSGRAVTVPTGRLNNIILYSERNAERLPNYHRLDFSLTLNPKPGNMKKWKGQWVFSILNLYARKNAFSYYVTKNRNDGGGLEDSSISYLTNQVSIISTIFPSFTYNFTFN